MKRVTFLAAALPAALGLSLPAGAQAATTAGSASQTHRGKSVSVQAIHGVRPDTAGTCAGVGNSGGPCLNIIGRGGDVTSASDTFFYHATNKKDTLYLAYATPHRGAKSKWKSWTGTWVNFGGHLWKPACSFSTGTHVSGYAKDEGGRPKLNITASNFTNLHDCA
jgi:hypothetical protein